MRSSVGPRLLLPTLALLFASVPFYGALGQVNTFATLEAAVEALKLSYLQFVAAGAPSVVNLTSPDFQGTLLAPVDAAWTAATAAGNAGWLLDKQWAPAILSYHVLSTGGALPLDDGVLLPTQLTGTAAINPNLTVRAWVPNSPLRYIGGVAPGAVVNTSLWYQAGAARLYLVDHVLLAPGLGPTTSNTLYGSNVMAALTADGLQDLSIFAGLVQADEMVKSLLSDPNTAVTVFAPANGAIRSYLARVGRQLEQFTGTPEARALLQLHILPARPYTATDFNQSSTATSLHPTITGDLLTVTIAPGAGLSVSGPANFQPIVISRLDLQAGKSVIHMLGSSVIQTFAPNDPRSPGPPPGQAGPGGPTPVPSPVAAPAPPPVPSTGATQQSSSSGAPIGAIVGGVVGGIAAVLAVVGGVWYYKRRNRGARGSGSSSGGGSGKSSSVTSPAGRKSFAAPIDGNTDSCNVEVYVHGMGTPGSSSATGQAAPGAMSRKTSLSPPTGAGVALGAAGPQSGGAGPQSGTTQTSSQGDRTDNSFLPTDTIPGLIPGDPFLRSTAPQYSWCHQHVDSSFVAVEAGINDSTLDSYVSDRSSPSPVLRLNKEEVASQIELMSRGLLGRGAHGLVFKCRWPRRFGSKALLAAKVLKDPFGGSNAVLNTYAYEASVLASIRHPNVVRIYGFCLELPNVCIIMELLPLTLKHRLYSRRPRVSMSTQAAANAAAQGRFFTATSNPLAAPTSRRSAQLPRQSMDERGKPGEAGEDGRRPSRSSRQMTRVSSATGLSGHPTSSSAVVPTSTGSLGSMARPGRMTLSEVLQVASDVAAGLAYLHARPAADPLAVENASLDFSGAVPHIGNMDGSPGGPSLPRRDSAERQEGQEAREGDPDMANVEGADEEEEEEAWLEGEADDETAQLPVKTVARIVHRDLKPSNILISSQGRAKLSDFGLSREHTDTTVLTNQFGVGTLRYMAPELLVGYYSGPYAQPVTNRVDIYSLAMVMWEMLNGTMPWHDMSDTQILAAVIGRKRPRLGLRDTSTSQDTTGDGSQGPDVTTQFKEIIRACWQQRELKRPTADTVYSRLSDLLRNFTRASMSMSRQPSSSFAVPSAYTSRRSRAD